LSDLKYSKEYFEKYEEKGRYSGIERGRRLPQFKYWIRYASRRHPKGARLLEVGCGMGYLSEVASKSFHYFGTDISVIPLLAAKGRVSGTDFIQSNAMMLSFRQEAFEFIVAFDILEHTDKPESVIAEAYRVLRKGGSLIVTVPNTRSLGNRIKGGASGMVPSMHMDPTHVSLLSPEKWKELFRKSGFQIVRFHSDTLWDLPYSRKVPIHLQKLVLIPFNLAGSVLFGSLPWPIGENLVFVCKK
jgi:2-polyprenyl-3-methyl-5-hydroxy-6-metoxy-1,4-benzoquinol methylase